MKRYSFPLANWDKAFGNFEAELYNPKRDEISKRAKKMIHLPMPDPDFSLEEMDQAEAVMKSLGGDL